MARYPVYPKVINRIVSADGTAASEKTWTYSYGTGTTITDPTGAQQVHSFSGGRNTSTGYVMGGNTVKTVSRIWQGGTNDRVNIERTTIGATASERRYTYDSYNNVIREDHYDFGAGGFGNHSRYILRYYLNTSAYLNNHMFNYLRQEEIRTNGGTMMALTVYDYDDYTSPNTLVSRSGAIPGWSAPASDTTRGNVTAIKRWHIPSSSYFTTTQQYDVLRNVVKVTDPGGHATETDFTDHFLNSSFVEQNPANPTFAYPTRVTQPNGFYVDTRFDFNTGLVRRTIDSLNRTTTMTYDLMNRETQTTFPNGGWTTHTYDDVTPKTTRQVLVDGSGNVGRVITTFDKMYRVIKTETADPAGNIFVDTQYDGKGRKWKVSNPYRSGDTILWTEFQYDAADRPTITTAPDGSTVQYGYNSNQTTVTDEAGNQRRYTYDAFGRMTKVEEPNPTLATPLVTTYSYNELDKLTQTTQGSQTRTFAYDSLGRMINQTLPESGTTSFVYNSDSLMTSKTDARGITTTLAYNTSHALTSRTYSDSTPAVSFQYDTAGRRTQMVDALGTVNYSYVPNTDRLQQEQRTLTGITGTFTTSYVYNIKGDLTQMTYPSGRVVNLNYATGGGCCNSRVASVVDQTTGATVASNLVYNAGGVTTSRTLGNGAIESFGYNNRLQLTTITATHASNTLMNFSYAYGTSAQNTGRVLTRTDSIQPEHSAEYFYDSIYRLSQTAGVNDDWGINWTFDIWGNRLTQTPQGLATTKVGTQTLGYANNRNTSHTYDAAGNQTNDGLHNYTFNAENQITLMDGGAAVYGYDGEGRRMKKTYNGETTYTFYGPGGTISEFTTTSGVTSASSTDRSSYRTSDKLGSAVLLMASNGAVIENNRTLPYGEMWLSDVTPVQKKKFTTYERDGESNLDYAMNRYLLSNHGRFVSSDKGAMGLTIPTSLNRYIYTGNDPINRTDPGGNVWVCGSHVIESNDEGLVVTGYQNCTWYASDELPELPSGDGEGGGGNGGGPQTMTVDGLTFRNWNNIGARQNIISQTLQFIRNNIDQSCSNWLLSNSGDRYNDLDSYIDDLVNNSLIGYAEVTGAPGTVNNASTGSGVGGFAIIVNTLGSFYNSGAPGSNGVAFNNQISAINSGSDRQRVFTLLHEFAHSLGVPGFRADNRNATAGRLNNDDVWKNCNATILGASNRR